MWIDWARWAQEPTVIKVHVAVAVGAFALGTFVMLRRKGTRGHRWAGRGFGLLAVATALTSFFIHEIRMFGIWSPIHLLSAAMLLLIWQAVKAIRAGDVALHGRNMAWAYLTGFVVAGAFTLIPGRTLYKTFLHGTMDRFLPGWGEMVFTTLPVLAITLAVWVLYGARLNLWFAKGFGRRAAK